MASPSSQIVTVTPTTPKVSTLDNLALIAENKRVEQEMLEAKERLKETQLQAELAKKRLEAEEARRKTLTIKKQLDRDNKRAEQEKARYKREMAKINKSTQEKSVKVGHKAIDRSLERDLEIRPRHMGFKQDNDYDHDIQGAEIDPRKATDNKGKKGVEQVVEEVKNKVKKVNPLQKAHRVYTDTDGANNPNFEGENNGHNAWLDAQLSKDMDHDMINDTRYAKRNADQNRFYDIDDVPM